MPLHFFVVLLCVVLLVGSTTTRAAETPGSAPQFNPCELSGSGGNGGLHAECAIWLRPLNYDDPDGEQIELFITRLTSTATEPAADAMTLINGGPGGSSIDMLVDFGPALQAITRERDLLVLDQRGTGRSSPMVCEGLSETIETPVPGQIEEVTRECMAKLPHDPRYFSTSVAVRDLEELRHALNYEQLSLYGVSYGTRVALHYLRRYPQAVRALVIDGVVPPSTVLGSNVAFNSDDTLHKLFAQCAENAHCGSQFPNLEAEFSELSKRLQDAAVPLTIAHPVTGVPTDLELTYEHFAIMVRLALYGPELRSLLPVIIHEATRKNNYIPIAANALRLIDQLTSTMNYGMHNAVVCTEDAPFYDEHDVDMQALDETYLGSEMYTTLKTMCSVWPAGVLDQDFKQPVTSDVPTLILSGELDPITPPRYGDQVLPGLSNATHIIGKAQGHGIIARGCIPKLILDFVEAASIDELDTTCVEHLGSRPFFVNTMGPPP